jgi:hypothetical protein
VRDQIGHGADRVKLYGDYRWGPNPGSHPTFSLEEMKLAVETVRIRGRRRRMSLLDSRQENLEASAFVALSRPLLWSLSVILSSFRLPWPFSALQHQLGLKLDPQKSPVEVFVIVSAEKPAAN